MECKNLFYFILVLVVNISAGRRFSHYPALHTVNLSKKMRRLLYIVDIGYSKISVVGFVWQIVFIVTTLTFCVTWLIFRFDSFFMWYNGVSVCEWIFVWLPLGIYSIVSEHVMKKRGDL